jgi:hypothetical protein
VADDRPLENAREKASGFLNLGEVWFKREIAPKLDGFSLKGSARQQGCRSQATVG